MFLYFSELGQGTTLLEKHQNTPRHRHSEFECPTLVRKNVRLSFTFIQREIYDSAEKTLSNGVLSAKQRP